MAARHKGEVSIRQINRRKAWDDTLGWTTVIKYQGKWDDIDLAAEAEFYVAGASRIEASQNGDQSQDGVLTVTFPAKSQAEANSNAPDVNEFSNTWTLAAAEEEIDLARHERFRGLASISSEKGYLQRVLLSVQEYKNKVANGISVQDATNKDLVFTLSDYVTLKGTATQQTNAQELADLILQGQETEGIDRYALRNVRVVPGNSDITASHVRTREMWSNDRMVSLIASGATQSALIGDIASTFSGTYWYKLAPTIDELNNGRYQIVTEFVNFDGDEFNEVLRPIYD